MTLLFLNRKIVEKVFCVCDGSKIEDMSFGLRQSRVDTSHTHIASGRTREGSAFRSSGTPGGSRGGARRPGRVLRRDRSVTTGETGGGGRGDKNRVDEKLCRREGEETFPSGPRVGGRTWCQETSGGNNSTTAAADRKEDGRRRRGSGGAFGSRRRSGGRHGRRRARRHLPVHRARPRHRRPRRLGPPRPAPATPASSSGALAGADRLHRGPVPRAPGLGRLPRKVPSPPAPTGWANVPAD